MGDCHTDRVAAKGQRGRPRAAGKPIQERPLGVRGDLGSGKLKPERVLSLAELSYPSTPRDRLWVRDPDIRAG